MSNTYSVVITGELIDGFDLESVKNSFAEIFKLSQEKAQLFFNGKPRVLKKELDHQTASKYKAKIERAGASVELRRVTYKAKSEKILSEISKRNNKPKTSTASKVVIEKRVKRDPAINAIESGRINQIHKLKMIEIADEPKNLWLMMFGIACIVFALADFGLHYLGLFTITGFIWTPIVSVLIGAVFIKSSGEN